MKIKSVVSVLAGPPHKTDYDLFDLGDLSDQGDFGLIMN
jgi:hypothetical protein